MSFRNTNLHGNAPDKADTALLLIDIINDLDFPGGDQLLQHALPMAEQLVDLITANDAYMRDFSLIVPCDCVASNSEDENRNALEQMRKFLKADTRPSTELVFDSRGENMIANRRLLGGATDQGRHK